MIKTRHHFIPQFWIKAFRDSANKLHYRTDSTVSVISTRDVMQENWLYTTFNSHWQPSDDIENALSQIEGSFAPTFKKLCDQSYMASAEDRDALCSFLGLQACRHPDILNRGRKLCAQFGEVLAMAHSFDSLDQFCEELGSFGINAIDALSIYSILLTKTPEQLEQEFVELCGLSPQSNALPLQDAMRADSLIGDQISQMDITLLSPPANNPLVLGDTPLPQFDMGDGFTLPLSKSVALRVEPSASANKSLTRETITQSDVDAINQFQWNNSRDIVVGSDPAILRVL